MLPFKLEAPFKPCGDQGQAIEKLTAGILAGPDIDGALRVAELHPLFNPAGYVRAEIADRKIVVHRSPAHDDAAWISLCTPQSVQPIEAIVAAVNPRLRVAVEGFEDTEWTAELTEVAAPAGELLEVSITKVSGGSKFAFKPRQSVPINFEPPREPVLTTLE